MMILMFYESTFLKKYASAWFMSENWICIRRTAGIDLYFSFADNYLQLPDSSHVKELYRRNVWNSVCDISC